MLTQEEADSLIVMEKRLLDPLQDIRFPYPGSTETIPVVSVDGRERFQLDVECGRIARKWKLQLRNRSINILVRLDIGGPPHPNPPNAPYGFLAKYEGERIPAPHIQRYVEGYHDHWALPLPEIFTNPSDVASTWLQFLEYCNVVGAPSIQGRF